MKKQTSRAKQAELTKNKIYECGVNLIHKHGFDKITVEQISKEAGVSVGTYYYYFESKLELFSEMFKRADDYFLNEVADNLDAKDCKGKVIEFFEKYADFNLLDGVEAVKKLYTADNKMFVTKGRGMQKVLYNIIEIGQQEGQISVAFSPDEVTRMLFVAARGVIYEWCLYDGEINLKDEMKKIISTMMDGLMLFK